MIARGWQVAPAMIVALSFAWASRLPAAPAAAALLLVASVATPRRLPFDRATSRLAAVVVAVLVAAGVRAADLGSSGDGMRAAAFGVGLAPLAVLALRRLTLAPEGGLPVDAALSFVTLLACGAARPGPPYVVAVALFVVAVVGASRADAGLRPSLARVPRWSRALGVAVLATAAVGAGALVAASRPAARYLEARFSQLMFDRWSQRTGFTESVRLGRVTRLHASRAVVLRLSGPRVTHLRGVALDHYEDERWRREAIEEPSEIAVPIGRPAGADVVEVRLARVEGDRLFAPLDAAEVSSPAGALRVDSMGALRRHASERAQVLWFRPGARDALPVAPPRDADLQVPAELREPLAALAREWVPEGASRERALAEIERRLLEGYSYSASYSRRTRLDAVAEFLLVSRTGHCEAFASAMTLLARSAGVPARLVVGYRVGERNPIFSHWVVRDSNAHAWVEAAGSDGVWRTYDPTPMGALPQDLPHDEEGLDALGESLSTLWSRMEGWLSERSVGEFSVAAVAGLALFAGLRLRRASRARATTRPGAGYSRPLDAFVALEALAAARGLGRGRAETLERWADRLPGDVGVAVRAYAAHRYGGDRDEGEVVASLAQAQAWMAGGPG